MTLLHLNKRRLVTIVQQNELKFCESSCLFYLNFNFDFCVSKIMHLLVRNLLCKPNN